MCRILVCCIRATCVSKLLPTKSVAMVDVFRATVVVLGVVVFIQSCHVSQNADQMLCLNVSLNRAFGLHFVTGLSSNILTFFCYFVCFSTFMFMLISLGLVCIVYCDVCVLLWLPYGVINYNNNNNNSYPKCKL